MAYNDYDDKEMLKMQSVAAIEEYGTVVMADVCELAQTDLGNEIINTIELRSPHPSYPALRQFFKIAEDEKNEFWRLGDKIKIIIVKEEGK